MSAPTHRDGDVVEVRVVSLDPVEIATRALSGREGALGVTLDELASLARAFLALNRSISDGGE